MYFDVHVFTALRMFHLFVYVNNKMFILSYKRTYFNYVKYMSYYICMSNCFNFNVP